MVLLFGPFPVENVNWLGFRWELNFRERGREGERERVLSFHTDNTREN
jgi:hypothetical protein